MKVGGCGVTKWVSAVNVKHDKKSTDEVTWDLVSDVSIPNHESQCGYVWNR